MLNKLTMMSLDVMDVLETLKKQPHTYHTILGEQYDTRKTLTTVVKNRMCNYVGSRIIMHGVLNGTRFGEKIFFHPEKTYLIFITRQKGKFKYYFCFDADELNDTHIVLKNTSQLEEFCWRNIGDLLLNRNDIIRWF